MRYRRADVVDRALELLGDVGLPDLTMRRLGAELGVQPSAIYHHFPNKQALLGAVADAVIAAGEPSSTLQDSDSWDEQVLQFCSGVRRSVLAFQDGADLVATMWAFGLGGAAPYDTLLPTLTKAGLADELAVTAARTLLHYVYGHAIGEQAHAQASRIGAIDAPVRDTEDFESGLRLVLAGIATRRGVRRLV